MPRSRPSLVRGRQASADAEARDASGRGADHGASGAKVADAQKLVETQLADLARLGPSDDDMKKARTRTQAQLLLGLQSNYARAQRLAEFELYRGDASLLNGELDRYLAVTKDDIKRVVAKYLTPARRSLVEVKPGSGASEKRPEGEKR
jgi:zinc protease